MIENKFHCPTCHDKLVGNPNDLDYFPFCSERCRMVDLGHWLEGDYKIAGDKTNNLDNENPED